ncbi:uncharacterized protein [Setaria viridis]|uniref:uncharacterized protein n=1 Tax=Setaria viridis TaxID=4556 RepID=UPI003B3BD2BE
MEIWGVIEPGGTGVKRAQDRQAMGALLRSVPKEMWHPLGSKKTIKEAWNAVKSMRVGADRVKEANAQRLLKEFENISFKDGEMVDDFAMRISSLAENLHTLKENVDDSQMVKKMLRVLPQRYSQIAISIETLLDLTKLSLEELIVRLRIAEDRLEVESITDKMGRLLLTEEDWLSKYRHRLLLESSLSSGGEKKTGFYSTKPKGGGRGDKKEPVVKLMSEGTPRCKGRCRNCGIYDHWKEDCTRPKKERKEEAHNVEVGPEHPTLMLATVNAVHVQKGSLGVKSSETRMTRQVVHLNEKKVYPADRDEDKGVWVLDTGASNHMTGHREALASLDMFVRGTVRFGDGSLVEIQGIGSVML